MDFWKALVIILEEVAETIENNSPGENMNKALRIFVCLSELPESIQPVKSIRVEHCDGVLPVQSWFEPVL